jgi:hypothetical protein
VAECTNRDIGDLLHAYEIGILSEEEVERFEKHLLECEYCNDLLNSFEREARLLTASERVKAAADSALSEETGTEPLIRRIWKHLWPNAPLMLRPAVAYLLVVVLAVPAYYGLRRSEKQMVSEFTQTVHLSPTRAATRTLKKDTGDNALLTFQFEGYRPGEAYGVTIESEDGTVIYRNNRFSSFDERDRGSLNLEISTMQSGRYRLIIGYPPCDSASLIQQYLFSVEE